MPKKQVKITLNNSTEKIENCVSAIVINNTIKYNDNGVVTILRINNDNVVMIRENNEYKIELLFDSKDNSEGTYFLKSHNVSYNLDIITKLLEYSDNEIKIEYVLNNDTRFFKLKIEE